MAPRKTNRKELQHAKKKAVEWSIISESRWGSSLVEPKILASQRRPSSPKKASQEESSTSQDNHLYGLDNREVSARGILLLSSLGNCFAGGFKATQ